MSRAGHQVRRGVASLADEWPQMRPPGPKGLDILKTLWSFQRSPLETLAQVTAKHGDIVAYRFGPFPVVLLNHPEAVHRALIENHPNYGKKHSPFYKMLRSFLGDGLLTSDGAFWLRQRRLAQPAFGRKKVEAMAPTIVRCTEEMVARWRTLPPGSKIDVSEEMMHLTLRIAGLLLFSQELSSTSHAVGTALDEIQVQMGERFSSLLPLPPVLPTPRDQRFRAARDRLSELALQIVQERKGDPNPPSDLLTSLLEARDPETGEGMTDQQLCDELITFLLAGHETTANSLTWTFYLLSLHPETRRRVETELEASDPSDSKTGRGLVDRVILETLRLYPPAWVFGRRSHDGDHFRGIDIPKNQIVTISPYILHRHPQFWPNPEGFDPDRFLQEIPRGAYVPFAAGPRQCIGNHFALLESRLVLSTIATQVRLNLCPGFRPTLEPQITLRPGGGMPVHLEFVGSARL